MDNFIKNYQEQTLQNINLVSCIQNDMKPLFGTLKNICTILDELDDKIEKLSMIQTKDYFSTLDKFYTNLNIVDICIKLISDKYNWNDFDLIIEPSAGNGNFLLKIPSDKKIGIDIEPEHNDIIKHDFLKYTPPNVQNILSIGNPPFGRVSSLAIKFFNHAAKWSNVIAFIIPKTFRKLSVHNKLNLNFHLILDKSIPDKPCSFTPKMGVKCCFQIWERKNILRTSVILPVSHKDWMFLKLGPNDKNNQPTPPDGADFAILAYGGKCGKIKTKNLHKLRPKSWHWIKSNIDKKILVDIFSKLNFSESENTARQNSMGKAELIQLYINYCNSI
jgi:hypothetical protein